MDYPVITKAKSLSQYTRKQESRAWSRGGSWNWNGLGMKIWPPELKWPAQKRLSCRWTSRRYKLGFSYNGDCATWAWLFKRMFEVLKLDPHQPSASRAPTLPTTQNLKLWDCTVCLYSRYLINICWANEWTKEKCWYLDTWQQLNKDGHCPHC